jgi:choline dehydrogenase-like flavoprotein
LVANQKIIGRELQTALFERLTRQIRLSCSVEVAPDYNNRVELSSKTDTLNIPQPKVTFTPPDYSYRGLAQANKTFADMFRLIGATEVVPDPSPLDYDGAGHIMGTCRMGNDPHNSVVDAESRTHDHKNLFVVGSSVFPTVGSPNPTLTLAALALRAAADIAKQLGCGSGQSPKQ